MTTRSTGPRTSGGGGGAGPDRPRRFGRVGLGGADELVLGASPADGKFFLEGAEEANLLGVAVDPGDGVVVTTMSGDLSERVVVAALDVRALVLVACEPMAEFVAVGAVTF